MELGKRLVTNHNFTLTIFAVTSHMSPAESNVIQSSMDIVQLIPPVDISGLVDTNTPIVTQLSVMTFPAMLFPYDMGMINYIYIYGLSSSRRLCACMYLCAN
jgi:hypothetical protein